MIHSILVSVIVPTHRRPDLLARCLCALISQDFDPRSYEIVVVDDGDCPQTRQLVEELRQKKFFPSLQYRTTGGDRGPAAARNAGMRAARGDVLAFTDDDCVPLPGWLREGAAPFASGIDGASGRIIVPVPERPTDHERNTAGLEIAEFATANCFYRRSALSAIGGFDDRFMTAWREDADVFFTLLERGARLAFIPGSVVVHPARPAFWGISIAEQKKSMFNALLFKKHPRLYRLKIQGRAPLPYYASVGSLALSLILLLSGATGPGAAAAFTWLLLSGHFCWRRLHKASKAPGHVLEMAVTSVLIPPLSVFWRLWGAVKYRVLFM